MILIDFNGVAMASILAGQIEHEENIIRHMVLNSLRANRTKFKDKYGELVICADAGGNWRKKVYENYKSNRQKDRDDKKEYWDNIFSILNKVRDEIRDNFPYKHLHIHGCEADDIIATLCEYTNEFGNYEDVLIVSRDKDFKQLQKFPNVEQWEPFSKKKIKVDNPHDFLFEHICRGDGSDGVPNILSHDDTYINGDRQKALSTKKLQTFFDNKNDLENIMGHETYRNFIRNKKMIDLSETPNDLKTQIINTYEEQTIPNKGKVMPYLIKNRCKQLLEKMGDFI
jgi:hypothetical protein